MANELKHGSVGTELTQAEWEAVGTHVVANQAVGDIIYASTTSQLSRLGKEANNTVLHLASGIPEWSATLAGLTLTTPTISSTGFANANHAHAASNSGGTVAASALSGTSLASGVVTTSATTVGVLNSGSINTGFGTIDVGSSSIAGGSFDASDGNITHVGDISLDSLSSDGNTITIAPTTDTLFANGTGVVVGHTGQVAMAGLTSEFQIIGITNTDASAVIGGFDGTRATFYAMASPNDTPGSFTLISDNAGVAGFAGYADDGVDYDTYIADVLINVDDPSPNAGSIGGEIVLRTSTVTGTPTAAITISNVQRSTFGGDIFVGDGFGLVVGHTAQLTSPSTSEVQFLGTSDTDGNIIIGEFVNSGANPGIRFIKSRNATIGFGTVVQDGDSLGSILFYGDDGTDAAIAAIIRAQVDGSPGNNDMPGRILFMTSADGGESVAERWRITQEGVLASGGTDPANVAAAGAIIALGGIAFSDVANAHIDDATHGSGTTTHYIGNQTIDTSVSDRRAKRNIKPFNGSVLPLLNRMRLSEFNFMGEPDERIIGLIAQEVDEYAPALVKKGKASDDMMAVKYNHLVPYLIGAIQELHGRLEAMHA